MNTKQTNAQMFFLRRFCRAGGRLPVMLTALLLGTGLASAGLVFRLDPTNYNAGTAQWPLSSGSLAPDHFVCNPANTANVSLTTKVNWKDGLGYHAVQHLNNSGQVGFAGPLCPASLGGNNPRTIEAWVYSTAASGSGDAGVILEPASDRGGNGYNFAFTDDTYNGGFALWGPSLHWPYDSSPGGLQTNRLGQWAFLAVTYDGTTAKCYINGVLANSSSVGPINTDSGSVLTIGSETYAVNTTPYSFSDLDNWGNAFKGYFGSMSVYDTNLDATTIASDYALGVNYGEVGAGLPQIVATAGTGGTISPAGTNAVAVGANQTFTVTTSYGYSLSQVLVDGVNNASAVASSSYTFTNVTVNHTIAASWTALPTISGAITNSSGPIYSVLVTGSTNSDGSNPFVSRRSDSSGNYALAVPSNTGTYYLIASKGGSVTSAVTATTLSGSSVTGQNFNLANSGTLDPIVNLDASGLSAGTLTSWVNTGSAGGTLTNPVSWSGPTVQTVAGKNAVSFDGSTTLLKASFGAPAGITGQSDWSAAYWVYVTNFFSGDEYPFGWARNQSGLQECNFHYGSYSRAIDFNGNSMSFSGATPAAGAWHLIVGTYDGSNVKIYVDGVLNNTLSGVSLNLYPGDNMYVGSGVEADGSPIGWAKFQGSVSSIQIFDQVLTAAQIDLMVNLTHNITPSAGAHGTITPATVQTVTNYNNSTFTFTPSTGYAVSQVLVDGVANAAAVSAGAYTFSNVIAAHTIAVSFISASLDTNVLVLLDASTLSPGALASWSNDGYLGGMFNAFSATNEPNVETIGGRQGVHFVQPDSSDASRRTMTNTIAAPASLSGNNPWTISSDLYSTNLSYISENAYFCWAGSSQGTGTAAEFNYVNNVAYRHQSLDGSFAHLPSASAWHNVTITYDGATQTIYVDGAYDSSATMALNLAAGNMLLIGSSYYQNQLYQDQYWRLGNAYIGKIQIYKKALSALQVNLLANPTHTITPSAGAHGTISPNTVQTVSNYLNSTFTFTPSGGYNINQVLVDGTNNPDAATAGAYTFTNVIANHTIAVSFISATLDTNLLVILDATNLPNGALASWSNDGTVGGTFNAQSSTNEPTVETIAGRQGVHFVQPDSSDASRQTLVNTVNAPASLSGSNPWTISSDLYSTNLNYLSSENGYFCWAGSDQGVGTCAEFKYLNNGAYNHETESGAGPYYLVGGFATVPSASAWHNVTITYDGTNQTIYVDGIFDSSQAMALSLATNNLLMVGSRYYHTGDPTQDQYWRLANAYIGKIKIFKRALSSSDVATLVGVVPTTNWTITATAGTGGTITPSGAVTVTNGGGQSFTIAANAGYGISDVSVDSVSQGVTGSYSFSNVTANHSIAATFTNIVYTIAASAGTGGSISPSGNVSVAYNSGQAFTITANAGYGISDVSVDSVSQGVTGSYSFSNVTANHSITATFTNIVYTIAASAGAGGSISPAGSVPVAYGSSQSFTITPNAAYAIADVSVDSVSQGVTGSYSFSTVSANHAIVASFVYVPPTAPSILPVSVESGNLVLATATQVGYSYYLLETTSLTPPVAWTTNSITPGTGANITNTPAILPGQPQVFYRYMAQ